MVYVYIIRSVRVPKRRYIGITADLRRRLREHNEGKAEHTAKFCPWEMETYVAFRDEEKARRFEKYLKTGAGWAFSMKRL